MIRVGISGWRYEPWRGVFYPEGLPQRRELEYAALHFPTVEINGSFYSLQRPESYRQWHQATPASFVYAIKGSRYITHLLRLKNIEKPLANFFASGLLDLKEKLGPFLWQLPPQLAYERPRLEAFFARLPCDTVEALALARRRDSRMTGRARLAIDARRALRHAVEVRHPSFMSADFIALARAYGVAIVVADTAGKWPKIFHVTSDFVYVRLHGDVKIYTSGYTSRALARWARLIRNWDEDGRDVYVYFDNDVKVKAPYDALSLMRRLRLAWRPTPPAESLGATLRTAGMRVPRRKYAYGPRVTGGNPAWEKLGRR